jgi:hypothetical protein
MLVAISLVSHVVLSQLPALAETEATETPTQLNALNAGAQGSEGRSRTNFGICRSRQVMP